MNAVEWTLAAWIGGSIALVPTLMAWWWVRDRLAPRLAALAGRRPRLTNAEWSMQVTCTHLVRAAANRVIAREQAATFAAMEQDVADWQRQKAARCHYDRDTA